MQLPWKLHVQYDVGELPEFQRRAGVACSHLVISYNHYNNNKRVTLCIIIIIILNRARRAGGEARDREGKTPIF